MGEWKKNGLALHSLNSQVSARRALASQCNYYRSMNYKQHEYDDHEMPISIKLSLHVHHQNCNVLYSIESKECILYMVHYTTYSYMHCVQSNSAATTMFGNEQLDFGLFVSDAESESANATHTTRSFEK